MSSSTSTTASAAKIQLDVLRDDGRVELIEILESVNNTYELLILFLLIVTSSSHSNNNIFIINN